MLKTQEEREMMAVIICIAILIARLREAGFQFTWGRAGTSRGCVESKYSARFYWKHTGHGEAMNCTAVTPALEGMAPGYHSGRLLTVL